MTNNNSNNNSKISWKDIVLMILSLIGTMVIVNWIADKVSTWLAGLFFPEEKEEDQKIKVETKIRTIINGKIADQVDQFIYDCKDLKRSKIGSHKVVDKDIDDIWDVDAAKNIKSKLTKMEKSYFQNNAFDRSSALLFTNEYFTLVNDYIMYFDVDVEKVSFEETDAIIDKYFGEA